MNHTARVFRLSKLIAVLKEDNRYIEELSKLLHSEFAAVEWETRQLVMVDAVAACRDRSESVKMAAELIDHATEAGKLKRQYQFGLANGIADAAGIISEVTQGKIREENGSNVVATVNVSPESSHANDQNPQTGPQSAHLGGESQTG